MDALYPVVKASIQAALLVVVFAAIYAGSYIVYNLFFHPLRSYPGPLINGATTLAKCYALVTGNLPFRILELHNQYGPVVRIAPNELAFSDPEAWKDIYQRRKQQEQYELPRDWNIYNKPPDDSTGNLLDSERESHDSRRKEIAHAFSERALRAQEPVIAQYVDLFIARLRENSTHASGQRRVVNMRDWIAFSTFDVMGVLTFGSDFDCLREGTYHPWIALIINTIRDASTLSALRTFSPLAFKTAMWLIDKTGLGAKAMALHFQLTESKTRARIDLGTGRSDFFDAWIENDMPFEQLKQNAGLFIIAGSETTATGLTGLLYYLLTSPQIYDKAKREAREAFSSEGDITIMTVNQLPYLQAVINEGLRCYPPVPIAATREVPAEGAIISGVSVPPRAVVGIWQYATFRDRRLFSDPNKFDPERFMPSKSTEGSYSEDRLDNVNPFIVGPRNCIGQNLAYIELKLMLAKMLFCFDMELEDDSKDWMTDQKIFFLWNKPPLNVTMKVVA